MKRRNFARSWLMRGMWMLLGLTICFAAGIFCCAGARAADELFTAESGVSIEPANSGKTMYHIFDISRWKPKIGKIAIEFDDWQGEASAATSGATVSANAKITFNTTQQALEYQGGSTAILESENYISGPTEYPRTYTPPCPGKYLVIGVYRQHASNGVALTGTIKIRGW